MASAYEDRVQGYGRSWHRPWLTLIASVAAFAVVIWFTSAPDDTQMVCSPAPNSPWRAAVDVNGLLWTADLPSALECARENDRDVLIAIHAISNTNCAFNARTVFRSKPVQSALKRHVLVMLYIDCVPPEYYQQDPGNHKARDDGTKNWEFQRAAFHNEQEPLYVIVRPIGAGGFRVLGAYDEGIIHDRKLFLRFLSDPSGYRPSPFWDNVKKRMGAVIR